MVEEKAEAEVAVDIQEDRPYSRQNLIVIEDGWDISDHSDEDRVKGSAIKRAMQAKINMVIDSCKNTPSMVIRRADGTKCVKEASLLPG